MIRETVRRNVCDYRYDGDRLAARECSDDEGWIASITWSEGCPAPAAQAWVPRPEAEYPWTTVVIPEPTYGW